MSCSPPPSTLLAAANRVVLLIAHQLRSDDDVDAPIPGPAPRGLVVSDRLGFAIAHSRDLRGVDPRVGQYVLPHGLRPSLRQRIVGGVAAVRVRMALDNELAVGEGLDRLLYLG